jgi:hypothetical protein
MSKKEYCLKNKSIAYYSGLNGIEIHGVEYGINDYIYCVSGAWSSKKSYHKLKINYNSNGDAHITLHGYKIPLNECIRMEV